jgi:hypothetical protein
MRYPVIRALHFVNVGTCFPLMQSRGGLGTGVPIVRRAGNTPVAIVVESNSGYNLTQVHAEVLY